MKSLVKQALAEHTILPKRFSIGEPKWGTYQCFARTILVNRLTIGATAGTILDAV